MIALRVIFGRRGVCGSDRVVLGALLLHNLLHVWNVHIGERPLTRQFLTLLVNRLALKSDKLRLLRHLVVDCVNLALPVCDAQPLLIKRLFLPCKFG